MAELARTRGRAAIARRGAQMDQGPVTEYLAFRLADDVYAGPVSLIREIQTPPPLTPVPRAPYAVKGIVSVRGEIVTVIDLRRKLRLVEGPQTTKSRILLVNPTGQELLGLYVDEVFQVYRLSDSAIEHAASALGGDVAPYISGIARPIVAAVQGSSAAPHETPLLILLELRSLIAT